MNIYRVIENQVIFHWVIELNEFAAIDFVKKSNIEQGVFLDELSEFKAEKLPQNSPLTINLGKFKITHTVEEWLEIYENTPKYLACSEY